MSGAPFLQTPAIRCSIGNITTEDAGRRVQVMGYVVDLSNQSVFILSDETGRIMISSEEAPPIESFIRVFGAVAVTGEGQPMIRAEIIQKLAKLDKHLFKRALEILHAVPSGRKS